MSPRLYRRMLSSRKIKFAHGADSCWDFDSGSLSPPAIHRSMRDLFEIQKGRKGRSQYLRIWISVPFLSNFTSSIS